MKNNVVRFLWLAVLGTILPGMLHAVAVPTELLQNDGSMTQGFLYGVMFLIFTFGIILGVWIKKKLH